MSDGDEHFHSYRTRTTDMAKGVEKKATTNKAKLSIKEKQEKKKEKQAATGK
jgi:hypothetical protein